MTNRANFRTPDQNRQFHRLITKLRIPDDVKVDLVRQFTDGRCTSSADMRIYEADKLIDHLKTLEREMDLRTGFGKKTHKDENSPENRMRRKILSICHELNWRKDGKIDWERLNGWLLKYGYLHKSLNKYTREELPTLVTQFENLLKDFYAKK